MTGISCDVHSKGLARSGSEEAKMDWKPFGCYEYRAVVVLHYKGHRENTEQRARKPVSNTGLLLSRCAIFNESQSLCSCCVLHLNCSLLSFVLSSFHPSSKTQPHSHSLNTALSDTPDPDSDPRYLSHTNLYFFLFEKIIHLNREFISNCFCKYWFIIDIIRWEFQ